MLARIAHELYWIGRQLSRAEHTARMLDGVFHADVQGRRDDPGVRLSWDALLAIMGAERPDRPATRDEVVQRLTLDRTNADVGGELRHAGARGRAHRPRRVLRRDVGGDQHVPPRPAAARQLRGAAHGPVLGLRVRQGALRPVLGRDRADDAARRGARVPRGGRADRGGRHGAADAARRAAGRERERRRPPRSRRPGARAAAGGRRLPGVPARRARAAQRAPGRALPALRARLPGLRRRVGRRRCTRRSPRPTPTTATRRRCCASAGCRPTSTSARARSTARPAASRRCSATSSTSSRRSTPTSPSATSAERPRPSLDSRRPDALRDPLPDRVPLPRAGHRQPQRAARQAGDDAAPARRRLRRARRSRDAAAPAPRLLRHDGDRVRHLQAARAARDRRAGAGRDDAARRAAGDRLAAGRDARVRDARGGEYRLPFGEEPDNGVVDELVGLSRAATPAATLRVGRGADPGALRVPAGRDVRRLDGRGPARGRRRRLPGLRAPRAGPAAPPRAGGALRLRATCSRRRPTTRPRTRPRSTRTPGSRR